MAQNHLLLTVTGKDHPGITARLTGILARADAQLVDIEQVVVQGQLTLGLSVRLPAEGSVLQELRSAATELCVTLDFEPATPSTQVLGGARSYAVTLIGRSLGAPELSAVAAVLAEHGANIERLFRLSGEDLSSGLGSVEARVQLPPGSDSGRLKRALLELSMKSSFDIALQREGLYRRSKRLVVMDMDSTLIRIEVIDELARAYGVVAQVSRITERAMAGEMDYDESLRQRLSLLQGMEVQVLEKLAAELPLTEGAELLTQVLKRLGYRTAVLSGGFSIAAEALKARLGIDYAHSNVLEVVEGKLTGKVLGPIVNAQRKAELLESIARKEGILLDQVIAVGDGANDLLMLERAGLGVAFRAKQRLREAADFSLSASGLDSILYLLGLSARELQEVLAP